MSSQRFINLQGYSIKVKEAKKQFAQKIFSNYKSGKSVCGRLSSFYNNFVSSLTFWLRDKQENMLNFFVAVNCGVLSW